MRGLLSLVGSVALIAGLVCLVLAWTGGGLSVALAGVAEVAVWCGAFLARWRYDSAVLRRTPPGEYPHLPQ